MIAATTIAAKFRQRLIKDAALNAWCLETLGKPLQIYGNETPRKMLREEDAPFISVGSAHTHTGAIPDFEYVILASLGVVVESASGPDALDPDQAENAFALLDQAFAEHVLRVLRATSPDFTIADVAGDYEDAFDPLFRYEMAITLTLPRRIGKGSF